jgi:hypothetical protein
MFGLVLALSLGACGSKTEGGAASASAAAKAASSAPTASAKPSASASSAPASGGGIETIGGADWKAVFAGAPPETLPFILGGGRGDGMTDDYTLHSPDPARAKSPWKYNAAGGGGVNWSPSGKAILVTNINLKTSPTRSTIDLWSKSALIKDLKHTAGPEVVELGPSHAPVLAGAGTCKLKGGEDADVIWFDGYSTGDFAHDLSIVIVAKDAPAEEKQVALSILRGFEYTAKAKPVYKK